MLDKRIKLEKLDNIKLSIGCGEQNEGLDYAPMPNLDEFIGLDMIDFGQDIIWDLKGGIPLPDNSCQYIWASHVFEHFNDETIQDLMNECWRVLKKGGTLEIRSPDISSSTAYLPQHLTRLNKYYFYFFTSPYVKVYKLKKWNMITSKAYLRKGTKFDLVVIMQPDK